jgi:hypothetical protein
MSKSRTSLFNAARQISALLQSYDKKNSKTPSSNDLKFKTQAWQQNNHLYNELNSFNPSYKTELEQKDAFLEALKKMENAELTNDQESFLEDFSSHLAVAFKDVFHGGELHYYEPQSELDASKKKDATFNAASLSAKVLQCYINSFLRQVSVNIGVVVSNKGVAGLAKEMSLNPSSLYSRFFSRLPGNFFAIQPSIEVAKSVYDKDPAKMTNSERILSVCAGVGYETFAGAPFEIYSLLTGFNAAKSEEFVHKMGTEKFLSSFNDSKFWKIVNPVSEKMAPSMIKDAQLMTSLRASGIDFSAFDAAQSQSEKIKEFSKIFDSRANAVKLAVHSKHSNISFTNVDVIKTAVQKYPELKVNQKDIAKIFTATLPSNFIRNSPFLLSLFYGLKDKDSSIEKVISIAVLLGAASTYPSSVSIHASTSVLSGSAILEAIGQGIIKANKDIPTSRFAISAASRVLANILALGIFHEGVGDYLTEGFHAVFSAAFEAKEEELDNEQKRIIDDICKEKFATPKVSRIEDDELTKIISSAKSSNFFDSDKQNVV